MHKVKLFVSPTSANIKFNFFDNGVACFLNIYDTSVLLLLLSILHINIRTLKVYGTCTTTYFPTATIFCGYIIISLMNEQCTHYCSRVCVYKLYIFFNSLCCCFCSVDNNVCLRALERIEKKTEWWMLKAI